MSQTKLSRVGTSKEVKRVVMDTSYSKKFYSTFNKFKDIDLDEARAKVHSRDFTYEKPSIRRAGEYMTEEERKRREDKVFLKILFFYFQEATKYNVGPTRFKYATKGEKAQYISNYVVSDFSKPASNHRFREISKDKWVAGDLKLC
jgi:hypothetical protein